MVEYLLAKEDAAVRFRSPAHFNAYIGKIGRSSSDPRL